MPQPARCFCVRDRFVADDAFWIAVYRHPRNVNERQRPKTDKKIIPEADKFLFSLSSSSVVFPQQRCHGDARAEWV